MDHSPPIRMAALSLGRGWPAAGAFISRSGPGEGLFPWGGWDTHLKGFLQIGHAFFSSMRMTPLYTSSLQMK